MAIFCMDNFNPQIRNCTKKNYHYPIFFVFSIKTKNKSGGRSTSPLPLKASRGGVASTRKNKYLCGVGTLMSFTPEFTYKIRARQPRVSLIEIVMLQP